MKKLVIVLVVIGILLAPTIMTYNSLVSAQQAVNAQWANVDSKLQRRYDLIPNLVESVKGAMTQEKEVFGQIADARAKMAGATSVDDKATAASQMEGAISRLLVVMEQYPVLNSNQNVQNLMVELAGTENRISVERDRYNQVVQTYNSKLVKFPSVIFARILGFHEAQYFKAVDSAQQAPQVKF